MLNRFSVAIFAIQLAVCGWAQPVQKFGLHLTPFGEAAKIGFYQVHRLHLAPGKPGSVKLPPGLVAPLFGTIQFQGRPIIFAIDQSADRTARIYVDSTGAGDLTGAPIELQAIDEAAKDGVPHRRFAGSIHAPFKSAAGEVPVSLNVYAFDRSDTSRSALADSFYYYADYAFEGDVAFGARSFHVTVADEPAQGDLSFKQINKSAGLGTLVLIDRRGDGHLNIGPDRFAPDTPFGLAGITWLLSLTPDGSSLTLSTTTPSVAEVILPVGKGDKCPTFSTQLMDGQKISFPDFYHGKVVLVDFWATWCGPCLRQMPDVAAAYQKYHGQGFEVLGVTLDTAATVKMIPAVLKEKGMAWPEVWDRQTDKAVLAGLFTVDSIPSAFLIDADTGQILADAPSIREDGLDKVISDALRAKNSGGHRRQN
jgi:thiol-disulfide isomerase/thioredoxin